MSYSLWLAFLATVAVVAVSPGPGAAAVMGAGIGHGMPAALRVVLGLQLALLLQLSVVALGLGALLATSELAFNVIRYCGAAYLIWLGVRQFVTEPVPFHAEDDGGSAKKRGWVLRGLLVNLSNPKAIIFIGALVPQFLVLTKPALMQYGVIALTMCTVDVTAMTTYGLLGSRLAKALNDPVRLRWASRCFGCIFVTLGGLLLFSAHRAT